MKLSCIITTRNRREALVKTLDYLQREPGLAEHDGEILVVDNGSTDGTASALSRRRGVRVISLAENEGIPARNLALSSARGKFIAFLDDDVRPIGRALAQSMIFLGRHPKTAAAVGRVVLPDGSADAPALPAVLMGGASVVRKSVLDAVGGFASEFFRQAADYELSFRIWGAGYRIQRLEDIQFSRESRYQERPSDVACRMDLRNNLILCERFLPRPIRKMYRQDWMRRYTLLARERPITVINTAIKEARVWARREAAVGRKTLDAEAIESIFAIDSQRNAVAAWAQSNRIRRIAIADWGKNLYATWSACRAAGLEIAAILDNTPAFAGTRYRQSPIIPDSAFAAGDVEGIVISNINPAQIESRAEQLEARFSLPILKLWTPASLAVPPPKKLADGPVPAARNIEKAA